MDQMKIGKFLKTLRREKGFTQEVLAEKLRVSNRTISRWENGANLPDLDLLVELADMYQVDLKELFNGERSQKKMDKELEETVLQVADYSNNQYQIFSKRMCVMFGVTIFFALLSLVMEFVTPEAGTGAAHVCEFLRGLGQGMSVGMLILGLLMTSGKLEQVITAKKRIARKITKKDT